MFVWNPLCSDESGVDPHYFHNAHDEDVSRDMIIRTLHQIGVYVLKALDKA